MAANIFLKIPQKLWGDLKIATTHYALECGQYPKDPERFLRNNFWKDFLKPPDTSKKPKAETMGKFAKAFEEMKKEAREGKHENILNLN